MKQTLKILATIAFFSASSPVLAEDKDHKDEASAKHGGQFVELEGHHGIEMVAQKDSLVFHMSEDHKPMNLEGVKFRAIVQTEAGTKIYQLVIKDNALMTPLKKALPAGAKIVVTGKDRAGHTLQARFVKK